MGYYTRYMHYQKKVCRSYGFPVISQKPIAKTPVRSGRRLRGPGAEFANLIKRNEVKNEVNYSIVTCSNDVSNNIHVRLAIKKISINFERNFLEPGWSLRTVGVKIANLTKKN